MKAKETLSIVVDMNQHAGICSRALIIYMTGQTNDDYSARQEETFLPLFKKEMGIGDDVHEADYPFEDLLEPRLVDPGDDGYDRQYSELDGEGSCSLRIFLSRLPTKEEWATLKQRAFAFDKVWEKRGKYSEGLMILDVCLVKTTTTVTEQEVSL